MSTADFEPGGYRYIPGLFQYSGGVAALPGYQIVRVTFRQNIPLVDGFRKIEDLLAAAGRPPTAFCACELRSPAPFTEDGFRAFNQVYVQTLQRWGIYDGGAVNPVARSNVCPQISPPSEPSFHAFSYTVASPVTTPSFVIAGSAEAPEGKGQYGKYVVRPGDTSAAGMREKARSVLGEMERRMELFGFSWQDITVAQVYTVFDLFPCMADDIVRRGAARNGLAWSFARPPVVGLDYEMDCRGVATEQAI
jgi:hypothetical protein